MRIFVALFSVLLLAWVLLASAAGDADGHGQRVFGRGHDRSWWRFVVALFTGELIYAYFRGSEGAEAAEGEPRREKSE